MNDPKKTRGQIILTHTDHWLCKQVVKTRGMTLRGWIGEKLAEEIVNGTIQRDLAPHLSAQIERIKRERAAKAA
ncbi:MAG TPA: hypothetical protein GXX24_09375 [Paracoccus solventivorans]|uniref:Uncharacterized protein n=1 Tax=Paracoccus solventivorans TaxID=53463 RepID=A0A832PP32_9RHOB|nr:hypothetical protein [Paracoccus solventivorans]HHW34331.1 hypothetical protein [Paracoccus solventivorans]